MDNDTQAPNATNTDTTEESQPQNDVENKENPQTDEFDIQTFESIRNIVTQQAQRLQEIKNNTKRLTEQLNSLLENDQSYSAAQEEAKQTSQKVKTRKTELLETSEAKNIKLKISDFKDEKKEIEDSLSSYLFDLYRTTGVMEFEDNTGQVWEYDIKAKLKAPKAQ